MYIGAFLFAELFNHCFNSNGCACILSFCELTANVLYYIAVQIAAWDTQSVVL